VTNGHSETRQMAVCCQNLPLGVLSSRSVLPVPVGALFKKFGLYLNNPCRKCLEVCNSCQITFFQDVIIQFDREVYTNCCCPSTKLQE